LLNAIHRVDAFSHSSQELLGGSQASPLGQDGVSCLLGHGCVPAAAKESKERILRGRRRPIELDADFDGLFRVGRAGRLFGRSPGKERVLGLQNRVEPRLCAVKTRRPQGAFRASLVKGQSAAVAVSVDANR
jgi:hypothetical protein